MNLIANFAVLASRRVVFGLPVCDLGWTGALSFINELASLPVGQTVISFLNAHNANIMIGDTEYRDVLSRHLVLPDGVGVDIASQLIHGSAFPANLNGTDFVPALLTYMEGSKRIGVIGARKDVLEKAIEGFRKHTPWHQFIAISDGYFDKDRSEAVIAEVERQKLDILIVGMGTPLQEKWVDRNIRPEHARLVLTVGALLDFVAGTVPRAPQLVRRLRLEWIYRLWLEPARLWKRYVVGVPVFMLNLVRYRFGVRDVPVRERRAAAPAPMPEAQARQAVAYKAARSR